MKIRFILFASCVAGNFHRNRSGELLAKPGTNFGSSSLSAIHRASWRRVFDIQQTFVSDMCELEIIEVVVRVWHPQ